MLFRSCEACQGDGVIKVEMHFLADVYVPCDVCKGKRYNRETLEIRFKGKNIQEILDMTVEDALPFFSAVPTVQPKLQTLLDVGLSYIRLGQSATTLSGGEAQRVKLSKELSKRATGRTLYILDEPNRWSTASSCAMSAIPSSSSSTISMSSRRRIGSWIWDRRAATAGAGSSRSAPRSTSRPIRPLTRAITCKRRWAYETRNPHGASAHEYGMAAGTLDAAFREARTREIPAGGGHTHGRHRRRDLLGGRTILAQQRRSRPVPVCDQIGRAHV